MLLTIGEKLELYPLIVTLREGTSHKEQLGFQKEVLTWGGVVRASELQSDPEIPEIPPYFIVYVNPDDDQTLLGRLQESSAVAAVEIPPTRFAAGGRSAHQMSAISRRKSTSAQQTK